jgi:hypothetical protein
MDFWGAASLRNDDPYPKLYNWLKNWGASLVRALTSRPERSVEQLDSVFCSQLVYLTLTALEAIPDHNLLQDFISPTKLRKYLLQYGFTERNLKKDDAPGMPSRVAKDSINELSFRSARVRLALNDTIRKISQFRRSMSILIGRAEGESPIAPSARPTSREEFNKVTKELSEWWSKLEALGEGDQLYDLTPYPKSFYTHEPWIIGP